MWIFSWPEGAYSIVSPSAVERVKFSTVSGVKVPGVEKGSWFGGRGVTRGAMLGFSRAGTATRRARVLARRSKEEKLRRGG